MEINKLGHDEAEAYWKLRLEALLKNPEAFLTTYEEALARKNPIESTAKNLQAATSDTYGAYMDGKLVGVVTMLRNGHEKAAHKADIVAMYVTESARSNGVGYELVKKAKHDAVLYGIEQLNLNVAADNQAAQHLYKKAGFTCYGLEKNAIKYQGRYVDEMQMVCFLTDQTNNMAKACTIE
ncbi:GNAT family N-acetyltransferase [Virgibacillus senegalensis]|uniref:GNAT family N-acetyltransferase n=1 Tax=Virgibacillus senegalensis TaxID=1499679 RepID=UPI000A84246E|nr:GNAT family N-acetyltransferase [Virgibacillus senegalensis]